MTQKSKDDITRERILDEAETLFARKGFDAVSIREITRAADCNLAAVNYHFKHKQNLYLQVFRERWLPRAGRVRDFFKTALAAQESPSPDAVVQALAQAFIAGPLSDEERRRHHQLITRELCQPTEAFDILVEEAMRPMVKELLGQMGAFMPQETDRDKLKLHILNIFGMILYFNFAREAVSRLTGQKYDAEFKDRLIRQITDFSLHGLNLEKEEAGR